MNETLAAYSCGGSFGLHSLTFYGAAAPSSLLSITSIMPAMHRKTQYMVVLPQFHVKIYDFHVDNDIADLTVIRKLRLVRGHFQSIRAGFDSGEWDSEHDADRIVLRSCAKQGATLLLFRIIS